MTSAEPIAPVSWAVWRRRVYLWTLTWLVPGVAAAGLLWGPVSGRSVLLGGALGLVNFQLLGGAVFRILGLSDPGSGGAASLVSPLRWGVTALATVAILWYMAGQPEGLAAGFTLSLLGFVCAAVQSAELSLKPSREPGPSLPSPRSSHPSGHDQPGPH